MRLLVDLNQEQPPRSGLELHCTQEWCLLIPALSMIRLLLNNTGIRHRSAHPPTILNPAHAEPSRTQGHAIVLHRLIRHSSLTPSSTSSNSTLQHSSLSNPVSLSP